MDESLLEQPIEIDSGSSINFSVSRAEAQRFASIVHTSTQKSTSVDSILSIEPVIYADDTVMYLVNYYQAGWVIISGDKRTDPILSYTDSTESISLSSINDGVITWMDEMADAIYQLKQANPIDTACTGYKLWTALNPQDKVANGGSLKSVSPLPLETNLRKRLISITTTSAGSTTVGPLITTKWGQGSPWNQCVPYGDVAGTTRCVTGCVAVATAQLMYYGHYHGGKPTWMFASGYCTGYSLSEDAYSYKFGFSNKSTSVWDGMKLKKESTTVPLYNYPNYYSVAILMGYVGWRLGMDYTTDESGASTDDVPGVLSTFGITCTHQDYDYGKICSNINSRLPVYVSAYATRKDHKILGIHLYYTYKDGHAWVIDGYQDKKTKYTYTYEWYESEMNVKSAQIASSDDEHYAGEIETYSYTTSTRYFIMNWGWNGGHDSGRFLSSSDWMLESYNFATNTTETRSYKYKKEIICDFDF